MVRINNFDSPIAYLKVVDLMEKFYFYFSTVLEMELR